LQVESTEIFYLHKVIFSSGEFLAKAKKPTAEEEKKKKEYYTKKVKKASEVKKK
jgi:hypothetical protein